MFMKLIFQLNSDINPSIQIKPAKSGSLLRRLERDFKHRRSYGVGSFRGMQSFANQVLERMESQLSFAGLVILVLGGLQFLPSLALGPLAEHFAMLAGRTF